MKPEEAIEELNHELLILECLIEEVNSFICDCDVDDDEYDDEKEQCEISLTRYKKEKEVIEMAISALKEVQRYQEIGTVEECREAVEKQRTKKIIIRDWNPTKCPTCGHELSTSLGDGYYKHPIFLERCPQCGQKLDWSEEE